MEFSGPALREAVRRVLGEELAARIDCAVEVLVGARPEDCDDGSISVLGAGRLLAWICFPSDPAPVELSAAQHIASHIEGPTRAIDLFGEPARAHPLVRGFVGADLGMTIAAMLMAGADMSAEGGRDHDAQLNFWRDSAGVCGALLSHQPAPDKVVHSHFGAVFEADRAYHTQRPIYAATFCEVGALAFDLTIPTPAPAERAKPRLVAVGGQAVETVH